uniref:Histone deacetylase 14 n=1 Tax=Tanacetum cinerariifolium TaxID=118510 RepID=A0A699I9T5_TANCI|nr:hypothetical protein [Tanacetum cinerariifolium]
MADENVPALAPTRSDDQILPFAAWMPIGKSNFKISDLVISNLFPKAKKDEVFGMLIPNELISNNIKNASYYNAYLEMVEKHNRRIAAKKKGKKKPITAKHSKPKPTIEKSSKPTPVPKPKASKEKPANWRSLRKWEKYLKLAKERVLSNSSMKKNHINPNLNRNPNIKERTVELDQGQARSDPGKNLESRPPPEQEFIEKDHAGPDPEM